MGDFRAKAMAVCKVLSANDTGETGGHQAGILVPKDIDILSFFPVLDPNQYNPRVILDFHDNSSQVWKFSFIYYNNKRFGGTRDEYRLTGMTSYIRQNNLKAGDSIIFRRDEEDNLYITYERKSNEKADKIKEDEGQYTTRLKLSSSWKVVSI